MVRRKYDAAFKARVALEAIKNDITIAELSNKYSIGPTQIKAWKTELLAQSETIFLKGCKKSGPDNRDQMTVMEQKIGQLTLENDFLKKKLMKFHGKID